MWHFVSKSRYSYTFSDALHIGGRPLLHPRVRYLASNHKDVEEGLLNLRKRSDIGINKGRHIEGRRIHTSLLDLRIPTFRDSKGKKRVLGTNLHVHVDNLRLECRWQTKEVFETEEKVAINREPQLKLVGHSGTVGRIGTHFTDHLHDDDKIIRALCCSCESSEARLTCSRKSTAFAGSSASPGQRTVKRLECEG
jgi:hypothetical protein